MNRATLAAAALGMEILAGAAEAQVSRVFVSVTGNDASVCSDIATPCRTFAGGITQVDPQGEVIVIASGSYAGGTITKSVKINVASGVVAFSGLPITVDPGAGGIVVLRGLTLKAATAGSGTGITHRSGTLFVEGSVVDGWSIGLFSEIGAERLFVKGSVFRNQTGPGVYVEATSTALVAIDDSYFERSSFGIEVGGGSARVSNSVITGNSYGIHAFRSGTVVSVQRSEISGTFYHALGAALGAVLRVSGSTVVRNHTGLENISDAATVESFGNNVIRGNTNNTVGTITTVVLQ